MPTAEKFLNTTGLTYFFNRLKTIFVQKEDGKGLSSNDYTTAEKTKLAGITTALNEKAPLASPALTGTPTAPTATAGTNTTQIATTAFVKDAVDTAIGQMTGLNFEVVQTLPATGVTGTIYLVPNSGIAPNVYDEYIYYGDKFEKIGTTDVDLSDYYNTSSLVAITTAEIDTITA